MFEKKTGPTKHTCFVSASVDGMRETGLLESKRKTCRDDALVEVLDRGGC